MERKRNQAVVWGIGLLLTMLMFSCSENREVTIHFDSNMEISGRKIALEEISPGLPTDWDGYEYVVLEFMITTPQRFQVGFTTASGYNELRVMSYTANVWNRLAIPLRFYREPPAARNDMAATYNQPRYTGWINLTGTRSPLKGVDSIGIRMLAPIGDPVMIIRSVSLSVDDPGDQYMGEEPVVDAFGQFRPGEWEGKIHTADQLRKEWEAEDLLDGDGTRFGYSMYGGYLAARYDQGTGFFRTVKKDGRWWFVDPEGYLFLSHGVDCVSPGGGGNVYRLEEREGMYESLPEPEEGRRGRRGVPSYGNRNLQMRYGTAYREKAADQIIRRMDRWGLNTIANWSSPEVYDRNLKAFTLQLRDIGIEGRLMGLADVYDPGYSDRIDSVVRVTVEPYRDNPWLLGYFTFNEPAFPGREERLCDLILQGEERPIQQELKTFLAGGDSPDRRVAFVRRTFRIFIETVDQALERHDPNHLSLGIRFGQEAENEMLELCKDVFDVFSFNCYDLFPRREMMDRFAEVTGKPLIIGEYHFGTVDRGMAQALWQVDSQQERGVAYRYYTEKAYAHPALIGTAWFQWCDQDLTGRGNDGENYNCGLVDVTDRPYPYLVGAIAQTSDRLYDLHAGNLLPVGKAPRRARGHHALPGGWNVPDSGPPEAVISNDLLQMRLYRPDPEKGYYRATRFDWSGVINSLEYQGHQYFGAWKDTHDPMFHEDITGPVESFSGYGTGFEEAGPGEPFVRIGVGILEKEEDTAYVWNHTYRILDHGTWNTSQGEDWIEFQHTVSSGTGWGYIYTKKISLKEDPPGFTIDHSLRNTGSKTIVTDQFNHNFFMIDGAVTGPEFRVEFPFAITSVEGLRDPQQVLEIEGNQIGFRQPFEGDGAAWVALHGYGSGPADHGFSVVNEQSGAGVKVHVDQPLYRMNFWATSTTLCPENFISMEVEPGGEKHWQSTYTLFD
ncbi:MAG: hypothetical protein ACWGNV_05470 [Bacteroidales bacterium]